ncbi:MAG: methylenetetrahydrofolate--tRNA-(uracil(54)-C(5))-methyltransferase (FADH(2)-oxidizing) TrmFO, partial [Chitinivibrionales bacterium]|nr:methylenetetrahydrofolate--tRNA-(uracil(54)-C(5))-methyltransferase (FADH(2)-oxidizing) TrmFO [Chitinivibrionales bacterium]
MHDEKPSVAIIGAGLAGSEAALVLASCGVSVTLYEMRPSTMTPAHTTALPAELLCSNSFKSDALPTAHGLLKAELSLLKSPLLEIARLNRVAAGSALAVDRQAFGQEVQARIVASDRIRFVRQELTQPPSDATLCIIAAGPLCSDGLMRWLKNRTASNELHFYDAIAPIVSADSIDMRQAFFASRWQDGGDGDYCNCPFTEEQYSRFYDQLRTCDALTGRAFEEERFFEACLPVEELARRGFSTLLFGPLRPVGLLNPHTGQRPFAVCQLRNETNRGDYFNLVGFQTRLPI